MQYNSKEFIQKFGADEVSREFKDKYGREKMFYLSPKTLWTLDEFINNKQFAFPEQFIKPVYNEGKEGGYKLKDLVDEEGNLVCESQKYKFNSLIKQYEPVEDEKDLGIWDYGFGSILNYKKYEEEAKQVGIYEKFELWDKEEQKIVTMTFEEASIADPNRYEGLYEFPTVYESEMPSENKTSYMIDMVTTAAGTIKNEIVQEWRDSGEPFTTTETRTVNVTVKSKEIQSQSNLKTIDISPGETVSVVVRKNLDGTEEKASFTNQSSETITKEYTYITEVEVEVEKQEAKTLSSYISGTIHRFEPQYIGEPDTSDITGSKYYRDYMQHYFIYAPKSVLTSFDFDDIRRRTGKDDEELLEILERGAFGSNATGNVNVDLGDFELGSGASSGSFKKAMQYFPFFEKYGNMYGVDPYLLVAIASQESGGDHEKYNSLSRCQSAGCGIMQVEKPGIVIKSVSAFNHETRQIENVDINYNYVSNVENNIRVGAMLQASRAKAQGYNILMALQSYNFGSGAFNHVLKLYSQASGKSLEQIRNDPTDLGWIPYVMEVHMHPNKYFKWSSNAHACKQKYCQEPGGTYHYGDGSYLQNVLRYYASPDPNGIWIMKEDGTKIYTKVGGEGGLEIGSSTSAPIISGSSSSTNNTSWLSSIWDKLVNKWNTLFPDMPEELPKERLTFKHRVRGENVDTIIRMMFVMEEQKYLNEYDDFTDEDFKEKFKLLFSNPVGNGWGPGGTNLSGMHTTLFPNGFTKPIKINPITVSKEYDGSSIEVIAPSSTPIFAISDGEVVEVTNDSVKIKHGEDVFTVYKNITPSVSQGDSVSKDQQIGTVSGSSLELSLLKGTANQDPTWLVTGGFNYTDYNMTEEDAQIIEQVISLAKSKIGCRYTQDLGYRNGPNSFDCSGFTNWLYKQVTGVDIGGNTSGQYEKLKGYMVEGGRSNIQPGDIVITPGTHVVLYIGDGKVIHASNSKPYPQGGVKEDKLTSIKNCKYVIRPIAYINDVKGK